MKIKLIFRRLCRFEMNPKRLTRTSLTALWVSENTNRCQFIIVRSSKTRLQVELKKYSSDAYALLYKFENCEVELYNVLQIWLGEIYNFFHHFFNLTNINCGPQLQVSKNKQLYGSYIINYNWVSELYSVENSPTLYTSVIFQF